MDGSASDNSLETCIVGSAWTTDFFIEDCFHIVGLPVTNNIAEVSAVILALRAWHNHDIHIFTDSTFVLHLIDGSLLAMERDRWPGLPWLHAITPVVSYAKLFQHLLFLLRAHGTKLEFSKVKAHDTCAQNNRADCLTNQGRLSQCLFDISQLDTPPNWVNTSPVLNNTSVRELTALVICNTINPPIFSTKAGQPVLMWRLDILWHYNITIDPVWYIPKIWSLRVRAQLKETIWKHIFSSLPLGRHCHAISDLGRTCCCGAAMSLDHIWASCPKYDLGPLLAATNACLSSLAPGVYIQHTDLVGSL